jgi:hypothetical protein
MSLRGAHMLLYILYIHGRVNPWGKRKGVGIGKLTATEF